MRYVRCKAITERGRCRRKTEWRRAYCPAHQRAHVEAEEAKAQVLDLAIELVSRVGKPSARYMAVTLSVGDVAAYCALVTATERLQVALVASTSFGGMDPEARHG